MTDTHILFSVVTDSELEVADITLLLICPSKSLTICHRQQINNVDRQIERKLISIQIDVSLYFLHKNSFNYLPDDGLTDLCLKEVIVFTITNPQYK